MAQMVQTIHLLNSNLLKKEVHSPSDEKAVPGASMAAIKTPCFITYIGSTNSTPASDVASTSSSNSTSPALTIAEAIESCECPNMSTLSTAGLLKSIATPVTSRKTKRVKAKGVILFDEVEHTEMNKSCIANEVALHKTPILLSLIMVVLTIASCIITWGLVNFYCLSNSPGTLDKKGYVSRLELPWITIEMENGLTGIRSVSKEQLIVSKRIHPIISKVSTMLGCVQAAIIAGASVDSSVLEAILLEI